MQVRNVVIGGIVASLVIGMWEMIVEAVLPGGEGSLVQSSPSARRSSATSRDQATPFRLTSAHSFSALPGT